MKISAFTQIIVTVAVTAWVFILPVMAVCHHFSAGTGAAPFH